MITQEELKSILYYDPLTGIFTWIDCVNKMYNGSTAGYIGSDGYWRIAINSKIYKIARLAFLYMEGYIPENIVDHIDRNRANNKWNNLRHVSILCNNRNCPIPSKNITGIKGVWLEKDRGKWKVGIGTKNKTNAIGRFSDFDEAACHRLAAEQCLDWSGCDSSSPAFQYVKTMLSK